MHKPDIAETLVEEFARWYLNSRGDRGNSKSVFGGYDR